MRLRAAVAACVLAVVATPSITRAQAPAFDVVSVKESPPLPTTGIITIRPGGIDPSGGWSARSSTMRTILQRAFPDFAKPSMMVELPTWVDQRRFDIDAKSETRPDRSQYPAMLQRLLADRFNLKTHVERRPIDVYWLIAARSDGRLGSRLRPASEQCLAELEADRQRLATRTGPITVSSADIGPCGRHTSNTGGTIRMIDARTLDALANAIQAYANALVIDRTGLTGVYQYDLEWDYSGTRAVAAASDAAPAGPTVFTAVQEQLGLKLERHRDPVEVLVIDSITLPTAN